MILNKGFAVAQWQDQDRHIFSYPYGWNAVWASVTRPGAAMERAGGWGTVLRYHILPLGWDELKAGQWMPNYFGHLLEGGLAYRRLLEWNRVNGVPFPTLSAVLVTQFAVTINEVAERESGGVVDVYANVWVERDSQKGIIIGHRGARLTEVGTRARKEIEALLGQRVYLKLHVKVAKEWQRDPKQLGRLGF